MDDQTQLNKEALEKHDQKMRKISRMEDHSKVHAAILQPKLHKAIMEEREARSSVGSHPHSLPHSGTTGPTLRQRKISRMRTSKVSTCGLSTSLAHSIRMENSYRMEPKETCRLREGAVRKVAEDAMKQLFKKLPCSPDGSQYDPIYGASNTRALADDIKARVRGLGFPRHKLVVHVILGQETEQSMHVASRCLWDVSNDGSVTVSHKGKGMYAVAVVYATYYE